MMIFPELLDPRRRGGAPGHFVAGPQGGDVVGTTRVTEWIVGTTDDERLGVGRRMAFQRLADSRGRPHRGTAGCPAASPAPVARLRARDLGSGAGGVASTPTPPGKNFCESSPNP